MVLDVVSTGFPPPPLDLMHPRLLEITDYLAVVRADLVKLVDGTPRGALTAPAPPGQWNGAQLIEHLGMAEGSVAKLLEVLFAKAMAEGLQLDSETSSIVPTLAKFALSDRNVAKLDAPERVRPSAAPDFDAAWTSLLKVRGRTLAAVATVDGRNLTKVSAPHPHPAIGVLNGYQWILLIGQHEERHRRQMLDLLK